MKILLIFVVLLLPVFAAAGLVSARESTPEQPAATGQTSTGETSTGTPAAFQATSVPSTEASAESDPVTFAKRFELSSTDPDKVLESKLTPIPSPNADNACVPNQEFKAYGFYTLNTTAGEVDFSVYSRVLYYALIPGPVGNIKVPTDWKSPSITQAAHKHGVKVDLAISNATWDFSPTTGTDVPSKGTGLRLVKSYVLLNMVDEIVDTVNLYGFDGVVIDFRLPDDPDTLKSFTFFIKRLKDRLKVGPVRSTRNDLLKPVNRQLSVVIDGESKGDSKKIVRDTFESVDLWLVEGANLDLTIKSYLREAAPHNPGVAVPLTAVILSTETPDKLELDKIRVAMWDVAVEGKDWGQKLQEKMFEGFDPRHTVSSLICTRRTTILGALSGITPILVIMLVLSWLISDLPNFIKKYKPNLVLSGLLVIFSVAFLILIYSLPSLDLRHTGVYVILASLTIPLGYIIWEVFSRLNKPDFP